MLVLDHAGEIRSWLERNGIDTSTKGRGRYLIVMQNVETPLVVRRPGLDPGLQFIDEIDLVNVVLIQSFCRRRATSVPDDSPRIDARDEESEGVVLNVIGQVAVGLVTSLRGQNSSSFAKSKYIPAQVVKVPSLPKWRWHIAIFVVPYWATRQIDQPFRRIQLVAHSPRMLFRYNPSDFIVSTSVESTYQGTFPTCSPPPHAAKTRLSPARAIAQRAWEHQKPINLPSLFLLRAREEDAFHQKGRREQSAAFKFALQNQDRSRPVSSLRTVVAAKSHLQLSPVKTALRPPLTILVRDELAPTANKQLYTGKSHPRNSVSMGTAVEKGKGHNGPPLDEATAAAYPARTTMSRAQRRAELYVQPREQRRCACRVSCGALSGVVRLKGDWLVVSRGELTGPQHDAFSPIGRKQLDFEGGVGPGVSSPVNTCMNDLSI
jgi:hypothetical protein